MKSRYEIALVLQELGITPNYTGYFQTAEAVGLCVKEPERLTLITKLVYAEVGKKYAVKWTTVERNIRTVAAMAWERSPLLMEELKRENPALEITALVRGENVLNDVTAEDARAVGLDRVAKIVGNGSNIGGTQMQFLGDEARAAMLAADVIVAKGQGNFETLSGSGLNVYYLFLAKCPHYTKWFGMEHMAGQLLHEKRA